MAFITQPRSSASNVTGDTATVSLQEVASSNFTNGVQWTDLSIEADVGGHGYPQWRRPFMTMHSGAAGGHMMMTHRSTTPVAPGRAIRCTLTAIFGATEPKGDSSLQLLGVGTRQSGLFFVRRRPSGTSTSASSATMHIGVIMDGEAYWLRRSRWRRPLISDDGEVFHFDPTDMNTYRIRFMWPTVASFSIYNPLRQQFEEVHSLTAKMLGRANLTSSPILPLCCRVQGTAADGDLVMRVASMAAYVEGSVSKTSGRARSLAVEFRGESTEKWVAHIEHTKQHVVFDWDSDATARLVSNEGFVRLTHLTITSKALANALTILRVRKNMDLMQPITLCSKPGSNVRCTSTFVEDDAVQSEFSTTALEGSTSELIKLKGLPRISVKGGRDGKKRTDPVATRSTAWTLHIPFQEEHPRTSGIRVPVLSMDHDAQSVRVHRMPFTPRHGTEVFLENGGDEFMFSCCAGSTSVSLLEYDMLLQPGDTLSFSVESKIASIDGILTLNWVESS